MWLIRATPGRAATARERLFPGGSHTALSSSQPIATAAAPWPVVSTNPGQRRGAPMFKGTNHLSTEPPMRPPDPTITPARVHDMAATALRDTLGIVPARGLTADRIIGLVLRMAATACPLFALTWSASSSPTSMHDRPSTPTSRRPKSWPTDWPTPSLPWPRSPPAIATARGPSPSTLVSSNTSTPTPRRACCAVGGGTPSA